MGINQDTSSRLQASEGSAEEKREVVEKLKKQERMS